MRHFLRSLRLAAVALSAQVLPPVDIPNTPRPETEG